MDRAEVTKLLTTELARFRQRSYDDLVAIVDSPKHTVDVIGPSGTQYYVDVLVHWDGEPGANVRVIGTIDDGGARAFVPITDDFIKGPSGSFVGEMS